MAYTVENILVNDEYWWNLEKDWRMEEEGYEPWIGGEPWNDLDKEDEETW